MNYLSKRAVASLKQRKQPGRTAPRQAGRAARRFTLRHALVLGLCVFLAAAGALTALRVFVWKVPTALVGIWEVTEGPMAGGIFVFSRAGGLETRVKSGGKLFTLNGSASVEGNTLLTTTRHPRTGDEQTRRSTIRELTDSTLVLELEQGEVLKLKREQ